MELQIRQITPPSKTEPDAHEIKEEKSSCSLARREQRQNDAALSLRARLKAGARTRALRDGAGGAARQRTCVSPTFTNHPPFLRRPPVSNIDDAMWGFTRTSSLCMYISWGLAPAGGLFFCGATGGAKKKELWRRKVVCQTKKGGVVWMLDLLCVFGCACTGQKTARRSVQKKRESIREGRR